jgi:hypothetical protein
MGNCQQTSSSYSATGLAGGAFPGSFTVTGSWYRHESQGKKTWGFSEYITVTSGVKVSATIQTSGSGWPSFVQCDSFGPDSGLPFTSNLASGTATVTAIKNGTLSETFNT